MLLFDVFSGETWADCTSTSNVTLGMAFWHLWLDPRLTKGSELPVVFRESESRKLKHSDGVFVLPISSEE